jgi:hypothetical protein
MNFFNLNVKLKKNRNAVFESIGKNQMLFNLGKFRLHTFKKKIQKVIKSRKFKTRNFIIN